MQYYLYDCEVMNDTLYLKFATIRGTSMHTEICSIFDFMNGKIKAENVHVNTSAITMDGKVAHSARELIAIIKARGNINLGKDASGNVYTLDKMGHLHISTPQHTPSEDKQVVYQTQQGERPVFLKSTPQYVTSEDKHPVHKTQQGERPLLLKSALISCNIQENPAIGIMGNTPSEKTTLAQKIMQNVEAAADSPKKRIDYLVDKLNTARDAYYNKSTSLISDKTYDELYDELESLEKSTGYVRPDSPTQNVGAEVNNDTPQSLEIPYSPTLPVPNYSQYKQGDKVNLADEALSLDKTKDINVLTNLLNNGDGVLSVKMDGLTIVLTYVGTKLAFASTRGNGTVGEFCLDNARRMLGVPETIPYGGTLTVRGEAYIDYVTFNEINSKLGDDDKYQNPRNLASGTIRTFHKPEVVRQRKVKFSAFEIVNWADLGLTTFANQLDMLTKLGFTDVVKHIPVNKSNIVQAVEALTATVKASSIPADGLVLRLNDLVLGEKLGVATKYPRHSLAFKWEDAEVETKLRNIEWQVGRTGRITPVAIFDPVVLEGSTIQKASIHNLSMLEDLLGQPYVGQSIWVYKANMIIPQVARGDKDSPIDTNNLLEGPDYCPCCGDVTTMNVDPNSGVHTLWCLNKACPAKSLQQWAHFVSREAMNINGLGESILQDLIDLGIINTNLSSLYTATPYDFFRLCSELEGYGEKKVTNILDAINASKTVALENVLYAYGIPNIGLQTAKTIVKLANYDLDTLSSTDMLEKILNTNGLGNVVANSWKNFMMSDRADDFFELCEILVLKQPKAQTGELNGLTFCCTGDVYQYKNRKELQASIEQRGGKFTTSVTGNTDYLITNTPDSGTAKNKAAIAKGIPVITEQQFIDQFGK